MRRHTQTILVAVVAVALAAAVPAGAHVSKKLQHLIKHLNPVFLNQNEKAADADLLDGLDSSAFQRSFTQTVVVDTANELISAVASATVGTLIQLEPGTYNVGSTMLSVPSGVSLQGAGIRSLIVGAGSTDPNQAVLMSGLNTELRSPVACA